MFKWKRKTEARLDEIEARLERIERAIGVGYIRDTGTIYRSISFRYGDDRPTISEVVVRLCEKVGVRVIEARDTKVE